MEWMRWSEDMFQVLMRWRRRSCGSVAAWGDAEDDLASVWQTVIVDLLSGGPAWRDSSCAEAAFPAGIDTCGARGDFARHCGVPMR